MSIKSITREDDTWTCVSSLKDDMFVYSFGVGDRMEEIQTSRSEEEAIDMFVRTGSCINFRNIRIYNSAKDFAMKFKLEEKRTKYILEQWKLYVSVHPSLLKTKTKAKRQDSCASYIKLTQYRTSKKR
jgi:hypothetical protein